MRDNAEYRVTFTAYKMQYPVEFYNYDGTLLHTQMVDYGATPIYNEPTPRRAPTAEHAYIFSSLSPALALVDGPNSKCSMERQCYRCSPHSLKKLLFYNNRQTTQETARQTLSGSFFLWFIL
ncbi:MAG: hypothetical protein IKN91_01185 [Paludibacteraceae bacterium]|nr:hypothetical protein [Paludibacteraceae bacterium]